MQLTLLIILIFLPYVSANAKTHRSTTARHAFVKEHPCPATGIPRLPCHGYIIDHIDPLCHGGADDPLNMQWQTVQEAKLKDREERKLCRH